MAAVGGCKITHQVWGMLAQYASLTSYTSVGDIHCGSSGMGGREAGVCLRAEPHCPDLPFVKGC